MADPELRALACSENVPSESTVLDTIESELVERVTRRRIRQYRTRITVWRWLVSLVVPAAPHSGCPTAGPSKGTAKSAAGGALPRPRIEPCCPRAISGRTRHPLYTLIPCIPPLRARRTECRGARTKDRHGAGTPLALRRACVAQQSKGSIGHAWFDMKAPRMTDELKQDIQLLRNRCVASRFVGPSVRSASDAAARQRPVNPLGRSPCQGTCSAGVPLCSSCACSCTLARSSPETARKSKMCCVVAFTLRLCVLRAACCMVHVGLCSAALNPKTFYKSNTLGDRKKMPKFFEACCSNMARYARGMRQMATRPCVHDVYAAARLAPAHSSDSSSSRKGQGRY